LRIPDDGVDLPAVSDDPGVVEQQLDIRFGHRCDGLEVEVVEPLTERGPFAQDRDPRQARLESLEADLFEDLPLAVQWDAPLLVVISLVLRVGAGPCAAGESVGADDEGC
jgi:hypothetical protein